MSYQNQRQELGLPASGSAQDLTSTQDGSKWHHGVDGAGIAKLTKIQSEIATLFDKTARDVAKAQINLGRLLNEARALIPGDLQFGKWREQNTPITNKSTANKLMNLAKQVGEGRITQEMMDELPLSTLKELISAPDTVLTHVRDKLRDGEPVSRNDVRDLKAGGNNNDGGEPSMLDDIERTKIDEEIDDLFDRSEHPSREVTGHEGTHQAERPAAPKAPQQPPERVTPVKVVPKILSMPLLARLRALDPRLKPPYDACKAPEWAWLVFGLDPMPAYLPAPEVIDILQDAFAGEISAAKQSDEVDLLATIDRAVKLIQAEY